MYMYYCNMYIQLYINIHSIFVIISKKKCIS